MQKISEMLVRDILRPACTIKKDVPVSEIIKMLRTENGDYLSIVDEAQKLIGAVSESNLIKLVKHDVSPIGDPVWFDSLGHGTDRLPAEKIMTTNITTITLNDNAFTALKVMNATGYKLLHVVDSDGKLLGIIRMRDIIEKTLGV